MLLYLIILYRIGVIVRRCTRTFPAILVTGLGLSSALLALVIMCVGLCLMPVSVQALHRKAQNRRNIETRNEEFPSDS